jgi:multidrug efflux pump
MRRTLGTAVFSGMLGVTLFGILLTPVFFSTIDWLGGTRLFASRIARRGGELAIAVLTLRPVRRLRGRLQTPPKPHYQPPAAREPAIHE